MSALTLAGRSRTRRFSSGWRPLCGDGVVEADLKALGVRDYGDATDLRRARSCLWMGFPQTLARWPNEGFVKTGELLGTDTFKVWDSIPGCRDGKFRFVEDRPHVGR